MQDDSPLLTTVEACRALSIGKTKLKELVRSGDLPAIRLGYRSIRFRREDVHGLVEHLLALNEGGEADATIDEEIEQ